MREGDALPAWSGAAAISLEKRLFEVFGLRSHKVFGAFGLKLQLRCSVDGLRLSWGSLPNSAPRGCAPGSGDSPGQPHGAPQGCLSPEGSGGRTKARTSTAAALLSAAFTHQELRGAGGRTLAAPAPQRLYSPPTPPPVTATLIFQAPDDGESDSISKLRHLVCDSPSPPD